MNIAELTQPTTATKAAPPPPTTKALKDLKKACEQFEAVFAKQLIGEMRKGTEDQSIGDQAGSAIYQDMMDQAVGDSMAHQDALGIGKMLYREFAGQVASGGAKAAPPATGLAGSATSRAGESADKSAHSTPEPHFIQTDTLTRSGRAHNEIKP